MATQKTASSQADSAQLTPGEVICRSAKIAGEALVAPGSSLILDGNLRSGGAHLVGGLLARWALGPVGWFLVAANSYSNSITGKHAHSHFVNDGAGGGS